MINLFSVIMLVFHLQLDMDEPFKIKTKRKLKSKETIFSFTICWNNQLRITDVALFGKILRFDDEIIVDCFGRFEQIVSNKNDDESTIDDGVHAIIFEKGVWPSNCVVYWLHIELKSLVDIDCLLEKFYCELKSTQNNIEI
jgi:hypothetical protein